MTPLYIENAAAPTRYVRCLAKRLSQGSHPLPSSNTLYRLDYETAYTTMEQQVFHMMLAPPTQT